MCVCVCVYIYIYIYMTHKYVTSTEADNSEGGSYPDAETI